MNSHSFNSEEGAVNTEVDSNSGSFSPRVDVHKLSISINASVAKHLISVKINMTFTFDGSQLLNFKQISVPVSSASSTPFDGRVDTTMKSAHTSTTQPSISMGFTKFPDLPLELRCRIWSFTLSDPKYIQIDFTI